MVCTLLSSVFTLMKVSLDFRLHQRKNLAIIHFTCLLWSSRPFSFSELATGFLLLIMYQIVDLAFLIVFAVFAVSIGMMICHFITNKYMCMFTYLSDEDHQRVK